MISRVFVISPGHSGASPSRAKDQRPVLLLRDYYGDSANALLNTVAREFGARPPRYNPLVLYGPAQVGKTLLAQVLASRWSNGEVRRAPIGMTGIDFVRSYAHAVDTDSIADFHARLRQTDCLLIDGLEPIASRQAAQLDFLGTIDALTDRNAQIVVTSRAAPFDLPGLLPSLVGRLVSGLVVPLVPPGPAARQSLVLELATRQRWPVSSDAARCLAARLAENERRQPTVPQIDDLVGQLAQAVHVHPSDPAAQLVDRLLDDQPSAPHVSLRTITTAVAQYFALKPAELKSASRRQLIVRARGVAIYLGRQLAGESLDRLGAHFGGRDHTTALHACRKTEELLGIDPALQQAVEKLTNQLQTGRGKHV